MAWWRWIGLIAALLVAMSIAQTGAGHFLLQKAGLEASTSYTALSFTNPQALPTQLQAKDATLNMEFTIYNASSVQRTYHWFIVVTPNRDSRRRVAGTVNVPAGAEKVIDDELTTACTGGRLHASISLTQPAESIDFWTNCLPLKKRNT